MFSNMGYTRGGIGKNGQGIVVPITPKMKSPRTSLGYNAIVASLPTPGLATMRKVLFFVGGVQTSFPKEKPTIDCAKQIDEIPVPHLEEFEHTNDIVVDMSNFSTPISETNLDPTSSDQPVQKFVPYHHPHRKNRSNNNHAFTSLLKRCERQNCGLVMTSRIDYGWMDGRFWNYLTKCLRTSYHCVSLVVHSFMFPLTY
jgi:hypothetical protein